jgi:hypothetical protein
MVNKLISTAEPNKPVFLKIGLLEKNDANSNPPIINSVMITRGAIYAARL